MKKYLKVLGVSILIGGILAVIFYKDLKNEVKALISKDGVIYVYQVGVFENYNNALEEANKYETNLIINNGGLYRVLIGANVTMDARIKMEDYYKKKNINYFVKEFKVNKDLIDNTRKFDYVLLNTEKNEVIDGIMRNILILFDSYI